VEQSLREVSTDSSMLNIEFDFLLFYFWSFIFFIILYLGEGVWCDVTHDSYISHKLWYKYNTYHKIVTDIIVINYNIEKDVEGFGINNIIYHIYNILILCSTHSLSDKLDII